MLLHQHRSICSRELHILLRRLQLALESHHHSPCDQILRIFENAEVHPRIRLEGSRRLSMVWDLAMSGSEVSPERRELT